MPKSEEIISVLVNPHWQQAMEVGKKSQKYSYIPFPIFK